MKGLDKLGFGFVEVGTVIPEEQEGLTKPRMFILNEDNAIIHRTDGESKGNVVQSHLLIIFMELMMIFNQVIHLLFRKCAH